MLGYDAQQIPLGPTPAGQHLAAINKAAPASYLIFLTPDERRAGRRMADHMVAVVQKTADYAANNASLVPSFEGLADLQQDVADTDAFPPRAAQPGFSSL